MDAYRGEVATTVVRASDADGDALSYRLVSGTKYGTSEIALDPADGQWKLRVRNFHTSPDNTDTARFVAIDSAGAESNVATITVHLRNRAPVADDVSANAVSGVEVACAVGWRTRCRWRFAHLQARRRAARWKRRTAPR